MEFLTVLPESLQGWALLFFLVAGFFAGLVDAMVGGGGLIQVPALVSIFPGIAPAALMFISKFAGMCGTASAFLRYRREVAMPSATLRWGCLGAMLGALLGAYLLTLISNSVFKLFLPPMLVLLLLYTIMKKDLGQRHAPKFAPLQEARWSAGSSAGIGLYDGFFGPGTGSFLVFLFVRVFGFDFVHASAMAKGINVACNVAALTLFALLGHALWIPALVLAVANLAGGLVGSSLALRYGSVWMRRVFIVVVAGLIAKLLIWP